MAGVPAKKIGERNPCDYELFRRAKSGKYSNWR